MARAKGSAGASPHLHHPDPMALAWRTACGRPDRREIYEWAAENVFLPAGVYAEGGGWFDVSKSRYLIRPFQALRNPRIRKVTFQAPVRCGKSLLADVWLPWTCVNEPGPFMWNMNAEALARRHMRTRILPVMDGVPGLANLLPRDPRKRSGMELILENGVPIYVQAPSIYRLQGVGIRYLVEDELRQRDAGRHEEAVGRLGDYEKIGASKLLNISQGGIEDDDQDAEFREGSQEEWMALCLGCGKTFVPVSTGYREDGSRYGLIWGTERPDGSNSARDEAGNWIVARAAETVRYVCGWCGHEHADCARSQKEWNARGEYSAQNALAPATHESFHIYGTCTRPWHLLAAELAAALNAYKSGILDPLMIYTQKRDALAWSELKLLDAGKGPTFTLDAADKLRWPEEIARGMTVDHQEAGKNWALVWAVGKNGELRRYWYGLCIGDADLAAKQAEWKVPSGMVGIDAGFEDKQIFAWCVKYGWRAMRGDGRRSWTWTLGKKSAPRRVERSYSKPVMADPEIGKVTQGRRFAVLVYWSNPTIKDRLKGLLDRHKIIEPDLDSKDANEREYRTQMRGQWRKLVRNRLTGRARFDWMDNGNDHARDDWNMAIVICTMRGFLPDIDPAGEAEAVSVEAGSKGAKSGELTKAGRVK